METRRTFTKIVAQAITLGVGLALRVPPTVAAPATAPLDTKATRWQLEQQMGRLRSQFQALDNWHREGKPKGFAAPIVNDCRTTLKTCQVHLRNLEAHYSQVGDREAFASTQDCVAKCEAFSRALDRFEKSGDPAASRAAFVDCSSVFTSVDRSFQANLGKLR